MLPSLGYHVTVSPLLRILSFAVAYLLFWISVLSLDVMDISGESQSDISHNIVKTRLNEDGTLVPSSQSSELRNDIDRLNEQKQNGYCGSCYGGLEPASGCCNTCEEVRQAYINRGWSFSTPDSVEQVREFTVSINALLTVETVCQ